MRFRIRFAQQIVGLFIVLAMAAAVLVVVLMGANQRWFASNYSYWSRFDSARGLSVDMAITFKGFEIGTVTDVALTDDNYVDVNFDIQDTYLEKVTQDSILQLTSSPIGLGGGLVFHQGESDSPPLPEGSLIPSWDSREGKRLREEGRVAINREEDAVALLLSNVNTTVETLQSTLTTVNGALTGTIPGPITDILVGVDEILWTLDRSVTDLTESVTVTLRGLEESVAATLADVDVVVANLTETTTAIADPTGLIPTLLDPKGSVATILNDDNQLYENIQSTITSLQGSVAELQEVISFLNDTTPQISGLLEEGRATLDTGQDVLEGVRNNPLIRRGIPAAEEQQTTFQSVRDEEF